MELLDEVLKETDIIDEALNIRNFNEERLMIEVLILEELGGY